MPSPVMSGVSADNGEEEIKLSMEDDAKSTTERGLHHISILNSKSTSSELSSFPGPMPTSVPMPAIPPPLLTRTTTALTLLPSSLPGGCLPVNKASSGSDGADDGSVGSLGSSSSSFATMEESGRFRPAKAAAIAAMALCSLSRSSQKPPHPPPPPPPQNQLSQSSSTVSSIPLFLWQKSLQTSQKTFSGGSNFKARTAVAGPADGGRSYPTALKKDKTIAGTNKLKNINNKKKSNSQAQFESSTDIVSRVSTLPARDEFGRFIKTNNIQKTKVEKTTKATTKKTSSLSLATTTTTAKEPLLLGHFDLGLSATKKKSKKKDVLGNTQSSSMSSSSPSWSVPRFLSVVTYSYSEDKLRQTLKFSCNQDSVGFATRLWLLTHDMDRTNADLMSWSSDGKSIVLCSDRLYEESGHVRMSPYIAKYFQHNKLKSLRRQICYYGFDRHSSTRASHAMYMHPKFKRSVDPTTLDANVRLVRKESNRGGSSGGPSIFLASNINSFEQYAMTTQINAEASKNALKSPSSDFLSSTQIQTGQSYPVILDKDTSAPPQILFSEPKAEKRGRHLEMHSVKSQNITTGLAHDNSPTQGRRTKILKTSQTPLPKSGWAFPKARQTTTAKKLELARSPQPLKVGAVPTSKSTSTPAKATSQRSSCKRSATVTPSCAGGTPSTDPAKKSTKLPPRSANGRFKKAISPQEEPIMKIPEKLMKRPREKQKNAARRNKYGRVPFVGHMKDEDTSIREALMEDFSQDTMSAPLLSSNMISSFLDSPLQRQRQGSSESCFDSNVEFIASSASYRTPVSKRTLEAASGMLAFSGPNIDNTSTPLAHNRAKKVRIGDEAGVAMTHGKALCVSPIDASKKSKICATPKTNADTSTPCSKFAANYTSSYGVSPSNFMPTKYTTSTNQVISPSTSKELANLLSSAADDEEILPTAFCGVLSSPGPNDASV